MCTHSIDRLKPSLVVGRAICEDCEMYIDCVHPPELIREEETLQWCRGCGKIVAVTATTSLVFSRVA